MKTCFILIPTIWVAIAMKDIKTKYLLIDVNEGEEIGQCRLEEESCGEDIDDKTKKCCPGLECIYMFGHYCRKSEGPCGDLIYCNRPEGRIINGTSVWDKSLMEVFPDECKGIPKNHGVKYWLDGIDSLFEICPRSCGCKKCNFFNKCLMK